MDKFDNRKVVGFSIRLRRNELNISLASLASDLDISVNSLKRIEEGKFSVGLDILFKISQILQFDILISPIRFIKQDLSDSCPFSSCDDCPYWFCKFNVS